MIRFIAYNAQTFFDGDKYELKEVLYPVLRLEDKNAFFKKRFLLKKFAYMNKSEEKQKKLEEMLENASYIRFYDGRSKTFLTGLLPRVLKRLKKEDVRFQLIDRRTGIVGLKPVKKLRFKDKVEKRAEQVTAVNVALEKQRGILHMATNAGKTECAAGVIAEICRVVNRPKILFLVHRVQLVKQTAKRFEKHLDVPIAYIGGGQKKIPKWGVLVATIQTAINQLDKMEDFLENCDVLFIDEFHINKAWACSKVVKLCLAPMRIGLSGTIDKRQKAKMMHYIGMTGPILHSVRNEELVNLGRSARPIARFVEVYTDKIPKRLRYAGAYREGIVNNEYRNNLVLKQVVRHLKKGRDKVLVTVARVRHGGILKRLIERHIDLPVEFISGGTPMSIREKVIQRFQRGKISVLIASPIFDVGMDVPEINAWVNAAGGKGWELALQRLGRVLRKKKGENKVYISDFVDLHSNYLLKHSLARIDHYNREKIVKIKFV